MAKSSFKNITGKLHLWLGLASGVVVFIVSITGCIFVFEEEIRNVTQKEFRFVRPVPAQKISVGEVVQILKKQYPKKYVEQIRMFSGSDKAVIAKLVDRSSITVSKPEKGKKKPGEDEEENEEAKTVVSLNPYTGEVLGPWNMDSDFLHTVEQIHKTLLLGDAGKWIIKFNIVIFLFMLLSGMVLWFPLKKNQVKNAFRMKFDAKWQRINYDFHNVFGFYFLVPLMLVTLTGIWWAVKPSQKLVYAMFGNGKKEEKKVVSNIQSQSMFSPVEAFESVAFKYPGWNEAHVNFAKKETDVVKINLRYPYQIVRKQNVFEFDRYSGKLLKTEFFKDYSGADMVKHANRSMHTGQAFGLFGKLLMFLASLFAATLPITGFLIWYQKKNKKPVSRNTGKIRPAKNDSKVKPVMRPRILEKT